MSLVDVRDVTRRFEGGGGPSTPLDRVSLGIEAGERVALVGPSGSGKTTLLHLIAGIDLPTRGTVDVAGHRVSSMSARARARFRARHVGLVFQTWNLIPVLTAYENVEVPLSILKVPARERDRKVRTALAAVGLEDRMDHLPRELSGGQQQRVAVARAVVNDPDVILADEPTGNLDREAAAEVLELLSRLNEEYGKTVVLVTHDAEAARAAKRVVRLDKGRLVEVRGSA